MVSVHMDRPNVYYITCIYIVIHLFVHSYSFHAEEIPHVLYKFAHLFECTFRG